MAELSTLDVLAIAAHPDDVELVMGGTLLRLAKLGYQTGILDVSRGEASTRGTPEIRASEAQEAASLLGCAVRINLGLADSRIFLDDESRTLLVRVLRELRPRVILTQHWEDHIPITLTRHNSSAKLRISPVWQNTIRVPVKRAFGLTRSLIRSFQEPFRPASSLISVNIRNGSGRQSDAIVHSFLTRRQISRKHASARHSFSMRSKRATDILVPSSASLAVSPSW